ncbi:g1259 [Coccomyxa elongata]
MVLLPLVSTLWWAYQRRERALSELAQVKTLLQHIALANRDWLPAGVLPAAHLQQTQALLHTLTDGMRAYFLPPRFYSTEFPYAGLKLKMMKIAQERAKIMRRITNAFHQLARSSEVLRSAGLGDAQLAQLAAWNFQLHLSFERMANIKEYRTPQGIRALSRCYVSLLIPIFFGPYYASLHYGVGTAFAVIFAILMNLATVGVLHTAMALEDPFDNQGLDGVYVDESLYEAEQAIFYSEELLDPVNHTKADSILTHHQGNSMKGDSKLHQSRDANITVGDSVNELPHSNTDVEAPPHH